MNNAQKAYETFKIITDNPYTRSDTAKLSIIYSIVCKAEKDAEYKKELEEYIIPDGTGMNVLEAIDTFFRSYNNNYGLDIRDSLTPFKNPDYPDGLYFNAETYKETNDGWELVSPISFSKGDKIKIKATLLNQVSDEATSVPMIKYELFTEGKEEKETGYFENTSSAEVISVCNCAGSVFVKFIACDKEGKAIDGAENGVCGALYDFTEMKPSTPTPSDLKEFWASEIDKLKAVNPCDTTLTEYKGSVVFDFDVDKTNYYHITQADKEYFNRLIKNHVTNDRDTRLDDYDVWELNLKTPGPCPATAYVTIPKKATPKSIPLHFIYAGYSAHSPRPFFSENCIFVYSTHHGYPCGLSDEECYNKLNKTILATYGRGGNGINSGFDDKSDCYNLYMHMRNLQVIRFLANSELSSDIPRVAEVWNGKLEFEGSSLGGYQSICTTALSQFLDERFTITNTVSTVPAFCDYASMDDPKRKHSGVLRGNSVNSEYFDAVHIATLVTTPVNIDRCSLGDEVCAPASICRLFNNLNGKKEIHFLQNSDHGYLPKNQGDLWQHYKKM